MFSKTNSIIAVIFLSILLLPLTASAMPATITFQGYLTDSSGVPVNSPTDLQFSLYTASSGGAAVWSETLGSVSVSAGVYSVALGAINPLDDSILSNTALYLGIKVGADAEMAQRIQVTSVAYALMARSAETAVTAQDLACTGCVGAADIAAGAVSTAKLGNNAVTDAKIATGISGSKISGDIAGNAGTATALAANPADCAAGSFAQSIDAGGNLTCSNGGSLLTSLNASNLSSGTVAIARGGTNAGTIGGAGSVSYSTGSAYSFNAAGVSGQVLHSGGTAQPTWGAVNLSSATEVTGTVGIANGGTGATSASAALTNLGGLKKYSKVAIVAQSGGDYTSPLTAMSNVSSGDNWCGTPSASNPCLLKIMPGVYSLAGSLTMQNYIDIEGSGESVTKITNSGAVTYMVNGANNAEIRHLTVENLGGGTYSGGISNSSTSPRITNVTVKASGGTTSVYGIINNPGSPVVTNVSITSTGGVNASNCAVCNYSSSTPTLFNVVATSSGSSGTGNNQAIMNNSSNAKLMHVTATATGGNNSWGINNVSSSPVIMYSNITASGGAGQNYGVFNQTSGTVKIDHSVVNGTTSSISNGTGVIARVGATKLEGGAVSNSGTLTCAGVYDENYNFYASTCP